MADFKRKIIGVPLRVRRSHKLCLKSPRFVVVFGNAVLAAMMSSAAWSAGPQNIDELGFNGVTDRQLFSNTLELSDSAYLDLGKDKGQLQLSTSLQIDESANGSREANSEGYNLDSLTSAYPQSGIDVSRLSSTWHKPNSSISIGRDWSNFQDLLASPGETEVFTTLKPSPVSKQIRWSNHQGLSIAVEDGFVFENDNEAYEDIDTAPSLVMSWKGGSANDKGLYQFSALGSDSLQDPYAVSNKKSSSNGWGVNMAGGWQFGDIFAALSVTVGNGIDHLLLGRFADEMPVGSSLSQGESIMINPRLNYSLRDKGSIHLELNHFRAQDADTTNGIDTLDTVHLGYSWSPWPSTKFGIELMGKDVESRSISQESTRLTIGAQKLF